MKAKFVAQLVFLLMKRWPAYRNYMAAYREVARREQLEEINTILAQQGAAVRDVIENLERVKQRSYDEGFADCLSLFAPQQETPDA